MTLKELILAMIPVECHFDRCYRRLKVPNVNVHGSVPFVLFAFSSIIGYATGNHRSIRLAPHAIHHYPLGSRCQNIETHFLKEATIIDELLFAAEMEVVAELVSEDQGKGDAGEALPRSDQCWNH